uniref:Uncharacterized protein n=1 Tax=Anguilla anguilla TaxID=7936 RepID=A0A0E9QP97_ANGAN
MCVPSPLPLFSVYFTFYLKYIHEQST